MSREIVIQTQVIQTQQSLFNSVTPVAMSQCFAFLCEVIDVNRHMTILQGHVLNPVGQLQYGHVQPAMAIGIQFL